MRTAPERRGLSILHNFLPVYDGKETSDLMKNLGKFVKVYKQFTLIHKLYTNSAIPS